MKSATILLTIPEVCEETRMSRSYIDKQINAGRLAARKIGRCLRVERTELERWIRAQRRKIAVKEKAVSDLNTVREKTMALHLHEK